MKTKNMNFIEAVTAAQMGHFVQYAGRQFPVGYEYSSDRFYNAYSWDSHPIVFTGNEICANNWEIVKPQETNE